MEKITSILAKKELHFHTVSPGSSVDTALSRMCHENVDYLIVMDDDGLYVGLLTEHDIASKVVITNRQLTKTKVSDIMNKGLPAATTDDSVERCMQLMRQHHVRYLPVFEIHSFRGIVSSEDILEEAVNNRMEIFDAVVRRDNRFGVLT
ncbi:MAG TPA: CBS domain-containing protein [Chitinophagaceae bacterium]|nr:CBS domain-containing protein [Chitinophagaceae bacterium]